MRAALFVVAILAATLARGALAADLVEGELGAQLDRRMQEAAGGGFSGVLLVAREGKLVIAKGYGYADLSNQTPFTSETVFDIGSITKQFTAAAIVRLEMDGKLRTRDKLPKYFDDVPHDKREITLHHLLTHASGLSGELGGDYEVAPRDEVVRTMLAMNASAVPGKRYKYSNGGYSLLGAVVEIASGQPYETYLREKLFLPAGMKHTGYRLPDWSGAVVARGVTSQGTDWGTPLDQRWDKAGPYWNLCANGGMLSTVGDLHRWHLALEDDKILSNEAKARLFAPHIREAPWGKSHYGYGWAIMETPRGTKLVTHDGGNGVFFADFHRYVDEDTLFIIASNDARQPAEPLERELLEILFPK